MPLADKYNRIPAYSFIGRCYCDCCIRSVHIYFDCRVECAQRLGCYLHFHELGGHLTGGGYAYSIRVVVGFGSESLDCQTDLVSIYQILGKELLQCHSVGIGCCLELRDEVFVYECLVVGQGVQVRYGDTAVVESEFLVLRDDVHGEAVGADIRDGYLKGRWLLRLIRDSTFLYDLEAVLKLSVCYGYIRLPAGSFCILGYYE